MGLFKKTQKIVKEEATPVSMTKKCAKCGKEHQLVIHNPKRRLDGSYAMPVAEFLSDVQVCDCGMLVTQLEYPADIMGIPGYADALQQHDSVVKKLSLLLTVTGDPRFWTYIAQYYSEQGDTQAEARAWEQVIARLESGEDKMTNNVPADAFAALKTTHSLAQNAEHRLIDAYRRAGYFDKALEKIQQCRENNISNERTLWLNLEEALSKTKNRIAQ